MHKYKNNWGIKYEVHETNTLSHLNVKHCRSVWQSLLEVFRSYKRLWVSAEVWDMRMLNLVMCRQTVPNHTQPVGNFIHPKKILSSAFHGHLLTEWSGLKPHDKSVWRTGYFYRYYITKQGCCFEPMGCLTLINQFGESKKKKKGEGPSFFGVGVLLTKAAWHSRQDVHFI